MAGNSEVPDLARFVAILTGEDDRFQVWIGGNPHAVDKMLDEARAALASARRLIPNPQEI